MASGISQVLSTPRSTAEHARVSLPGIVAPLLVDEPAQPPDWGRGTSREAVERCTIGPSDAAGCWEGSEGGKGGEERGHCTPAWSPFASEAPPAAASLGSATILQPERRASAAASSEFCSLQHLEIHQVLRHELHRDS